MSMQIRCLILGGLMLVFGLLSVSLKSVTAHIPDSTTSIFLPLVTNQRSTCLPIKSGPFGVQMFGNSGSTSPYYSLLVNSGSHWVRNRIAWSSVEPINVTPDKYNWNEADSIVGAARDACRNMIITHDYAPSWAATFPGGPIDKVSIDELTQYISALVERYDGDGLDDAPGSPKINYWEFYNEPDTVPSPAGNRWGDVGDKYAQMLASVYPVVKSANPSAKVVFGGVAYDWFEDQGGPFQRSFLDDVFKVDKGANFDYMNFHTYPPLATNWTTNGGPGVYEKAVAIHKKMQEYGFDKPTVITEFGDHNNPYPPLPGSDFSQTRHAVKLYTQALAADIEFGVWFLLYDLGGDYQFNSGLVTQEAVPKPAYFVYQHAVKELTPLQFDRTLSLTETNASEMDAYRFINPTTSQVVYVAWLNPIDATGEKTLNLLGKQAIVKDLFGQPHTVNDTDDGNNDGKITLGVSASPIYIEMVN